MRTEQLNGHKIKYFDSIEDLPIIRFHKYNKYLLIDSGIGSDIQDIDGHIYKAIKYVKLNPELAIQELENLTNAIHLISDEINAKHMAFATLIDEIDGIKREDLSDDGIKETLKMINKESNSLINRFIEAVKKKISAELTLYFKGQFENTIEKEYYESLRKRVLYLLSEITKGENNQTEIESIDRYLLNLNKPIRFTGSNGFEVSYDKNFEEVNIILRHRLSIEPEKMTVMQYYTALDYLKQQNKKKK